MTTLPFVFQTATEYARTGDLPTVLAQATDDNSDLNHETRAQMLTGIAMRDDITAKTFNTLLRTFPRNAWTLLAAMLNNPLLHRAPKTYAKTRRMIHPDGIHTLIANLNQPADILPDIIVASHRYTQMPNVYETVTDAFPADQIRAAVDALLDDYIAALTEGGGGFYTAIYGVPEILFLDDDHITRLASFIRDALVRAAAEDDERVAHEKAGNFESPLSRLAARPDITVTHGHLILDAIEAIAVIEDRIEARYGERYIARAPSLVARSNLPQPVIARALTNHRLADALSADRHSTLRILPGTIIDALRNGADVSLLERYSTHRMDADVLDLILDNLATGNATGDEVAGHLRNLLRNSINLIGTPQWDRLYTACLTHFTDTFDGYVQDLVAEVVTARALRWADDSTVPVVHQFAAWASQSDDPLLRRHAVTFAWSPHQLLAATRDPSPLVRIQVLDRNDTDIRVPVEALHALRDDPDVSIRLGVAQHPATSEATLRAMADDSDDAVRAAVAERFLRALAATS